LGFSAIGIEDFVMIGKVITLSMLAVAGAMELTPENWDAETAGKTVFIKFQAPW
jgi:hypothetical protein